MEEVKANCLQSASNSPLEVNQIMTLYLQIRKLLRNVGFVIVSRLATNIIQQMTLINLSVEKIFSKSVTIALVESSLGKAIDTA